MTHEEFQRGVRASLDRFNQTVANARHAAKMEIMAQVSRAANLESEVITAILLSEDERQETLLRGMTK